MHTYTLIFQISMFLPFYVHILNIKFVHHIIIKINLYNHTAKIVFFPIVRVIPAIPVYMKHPHSIFI